MSFCGKCGASLESGGEFCSKCGTRSDSFNEQPTSQQMPLGGYENRATKPPNKSNHRLIGLIACALVVIVAIVGVASVFGGNKLEGTRWVAENVLIDGVSASKWLEDNRLSGERPISDVEIKSIGQEYYGIGEWSLEFMSDGKALWDADNRIMYYSVNKKRLSLYDDNMKEVMSGIRSGNIITFSVTRLDYLYGDLVILSLTLTYKKKSK